MKTLVYYEKKKILKRKSTLITCLLMLLCIAALSLVFISDEFYYMADGTEVKGMEAIRVQRDMDHALAGPLTTERIEDVLHRYQTIYDDPDNYNSAGFIKDEVYWKDILPYRGILSLMERVYSPPGTYDFDILSRVTDEMADRFYEVRHGQVQETLNMDYTIGNFTQAEKETVLKLDSTVSEPLTFDYTDGWKTLLIRDFQTVFLMIGIAVCVIISPVFAYEYQTGADALVLSSRYGRRETVRAKITAGFLVTSRIYLLVVIAGFISVLVPYGMQGWNCDVQLLSTSSFYGLKIWQLVLLGLTINYVVVLSIMAFTMLLSAACKTPFAAVMIGTICTVAPLFFPTSKSSKLLNQIISLLPANAMDTHVVFSAYVLFPFGKLIITLPCMILISALVLIAVMLPAAQRQFCRHQVV